MDTTTTEDMRRAAELCREAYFEDCHRHGRPGYFSAALVYGRLDEFVARVIAEKARGPR